MPLSSENSQVPKPGGARKAARILYADDMHELRDLMRIALVHDGYTVTCAPDGATALKVMEQDPLPYDLLITDHHMPNMNGLELITRARDLSFPGKVLIFSSELSHGILAAYHQLKVDKILYKPVAPPALRQALAEIFEAPTPLPPPI